MTDTLSGETTLVELGFYRLCGHGEYKRRVRLPVELLPFESIETTCPACGIHMLVLGTELHHL
jgi:hypothetical protein